MELKKLMKCEHCWNEFEPEQMHNKFICLSCWADEEFIGEYLGGEDD